MNAVIRYFRLPYFPKWAPWVFVVAALGGVASVVLPWAWLGNGGFVVSALILMSYVGSHVEGSEDEKARSACIAGTTVLLAWLVAILATAGLMWIGW